ncbi:MAG: hypothetical protein HOV78_11445 [Hamadaea sp.]|nr:hypothetical protein [Hamadaea sp.]
MTAPLQCQVEAARFASSSTTVDAVRHRTVREAVRQLRAGDRAAALQAMYAGLKLQAPLSFRLPTVTR